MTKVATAVVSTAQFHSPNIIMSDKRPQQSVSQSEMDLWNRVIGRRRQQWTSLPRTVLVAVIRPLWSSEPSPPLQINDPWEQTEWLLTSHFNLAVDRTISPKKRRAAWHRVNSLLKSLDQEGSSFQHSNEHSKNDDRAVVAQQTNANKAASAPLEPLQAKNNSAPVQEKQASSQTEPNRSSLTAKKPADAQKPAALAGVQTSSTKKVVAAKATGGAKPPPPQQKEPPKRQQEQAAHHSSGEEPVALSSKPTTSASAIPRRATPTPPSTTTTTTTVVAQRPDKKNIGSSMGSAFSSTAKVAPTTAPPATKKTAPPPATKKTAALPPGRPVSISFAADTNRFAGAVDKSGRSSLRVTFPYRAISSQESQRTLARLQTWDPYWQVQHVVAMVETFPISRVENLKTGTRPQQATECTIQLGLKEAAKIRDWGKLLEKGHRYKHGETRLLVRMLPVKPVQKKRPRADTHLWPKGTFLQLSGLPIAIDQRRQQQHDPREWKSMSTPLDLSTKLAYPTSSNKMQLYFLDKEPYVMCVAVCSYKSPDAVVNSLVSSPNWARLSMEQAKAKALENAKRQTVVLDDTDESSSNDLSSFIFPLTCPVSQQLLKTPVRGKQCNHWQCFDLRNFVESNSHVTGTRWECPVCSKILSLEDLEYCPLTDSILKEYKGTATPHRDRVQFFADGTWKLLGEAKKRYGKKRPAEVDSMTGNKRQCTNGAIARTPNSPEVIDLL